MIKLEGLKSPRLSWREVRTVNKSIDHCISICSRNTRAALGRAAILLRVHLLAGIARQHLVVARIAGMNQPLIPVHGSPGGTPEHDCLEYLCEVALRRV